MSGKSVEAAAAVTAPTAIARRPKLIIIRASVVTSVVRGVVPRAAVVRVGVVVGRVAHAVSPGREAGLHWIHVVDDVGAPHRLPEELHHRPRRQVGGHPHGLRWNVAHHVVHS